MASQRNNARPHLERRAFSLLELMAVVTIVGLIAAVAVTQFGHEAVATTDGKGFARRLALALTVARQQAGAEGTPAAVVVAREGGVPTSVTVVRAGGTDIAVDDPLTVPKGVTLQAPHDRWQFEYTGSLSTPASGGTLTVSTAYWYWEVSVNAVTGRIDVVEVYNP